MIKKLLRKISALSIAVLSCCVFAIGCGANDKSKPLTADQSHLFGMCELTIDTIVGDRVDSTVNNEWVADKMGELGVDTARVWLHHTNILYRSERSNELYLNETVASHFHDYFQKLKENGVKRILAMSHRFIQPYGYPGDELSVPDPWEEPEYYQQFLDIQERAYQIIATEFPEIDFYEPGNEWDDEEQGLYLHRAGWSLGKGDLVYSAAEAGQIAADVCYYANRGIKSVNPDAKVVSPGTTWCYSGITFLDSMYQSIEEGRHPTGEDVADKNVDNYFQIVAWHPYIDPEYEKVDDEIMIDAWLEYNKQWHDVMVKHGDGNKTVFFTEIGLTDDRYTGSNGQNIIANRLKLILDAVKSEMKYVETLFVFRLATCEEFLGNNDFENGFGIFYSPSHIDENKQSTPKPIAEMLYEYFNPGQLAKDKVWSK